MPKLIACLLALLCSATGVSAEEFPWKPLRIIVAYPAGSTADIRSRELAQLLAQRVGQAVIVDNKPGAGGTIGTGFAARAAADGHTLLWGFNANLGIAPHMTANAGYDPLKDFAPVAQVMLTNMILVVHPSLPVKSLPDLVRLAKAKPGQLTYGSSGAGSIQQMAMELLKKAAGIDVLNVPYKGDNEVFLDLANDRLSMTFATMTAATPHVTSGKLKALAVSGAKRLANFPNVPTVAEQGYPEYEWHNWAGYVAPAGTPKPVIDRLNREITDIYQSELKSKLAALNIEVVTGTPEQFDELIRRDFARYGKLVRELGLLPR